MDIESNIHAHKSSLEAMASEPKNELVDAINAVFKSLGVLNNKEILINFNQERRDKIPEPYYNLLLDAGFKESTQNNQLSLSKSDFNKFCQTKAIDLNTSQYIFLSRIQDMIPHVENVIMQDMTKFFEVEQSRN